MNVKNIFPQMMDRLRYWFYDQKRKKMLRLKKGEKNQIYPHW